MQNLLQDLVHAIEQNLLPSGFKVVKGEPHFENGVQVAEFDVHITGELGSSSVDWLIECRDRPSDGRAPSSWIEQLIGRRQRFHFDKVIAVSTTGFARPAHDLAKREHILLRTVDKLTDVADDFKVLQLRIKTFSIEFPQPRQLSIEFPQPGQLPIVGHSGIKEMLQGAKKLWCCRDGETEFHEFPGFLAEDLARANPKLVAGDEGKRVRIKLDVGPLAIRSENGPTIKVKSLEGLFEFVLSITECRALSVKVYSEGERRFGYVADFEGETPGGKVLMSVLVTEGASGVKVEPFGETLLPPNFIPWPPDISD